MDSFHELDQYLAVSYNLNLWSDDAIDKASQLLDEFTDVEWLLLKTAWRNRPIEWQIKLADAVYGSDKPRVIGLLCEMLTSGEIKVAMAAVESLEAKDYMWTPDVTLENALRKLLKSVEPGEQHLVQLLLNRIVK